MINRYTLAIMLLLLLLIVPAAQSQVPKIFSPSIQRAAQIVHASRALSQPAQAGKAADAGVRLIETQVEIEILEEWRPSGMTVYTYDGDLRIQEEQFAATEDGRWKAATRTLFAHENNGELRYATEIRTWNPDTGSYDPETRFQVDWVCFVFTTGRCAIHVQTEQQWDGATWVNVERTTYAYYDFEPLAEGHPIKSHTLEEWRGGKWVLVEKHSFDEYYSGTHVETWMTRQTWDGGAWVNAERTVYHYLMLHLVQDRLSEIWDELQDYGGLLLPLQFPDYYFSIWEDGTWKQQVRQRTTITREGDRRVLYKAVTEQHEDAWTRTGTLTIEYDDYGLPLILIAEGVLDEEEVEEAPGALFERYFWNDAGKLINARRGIIVIDTEIPFMRYTYTWTNDGSVSTETPPQTVSFALDPAYPNPFRSSTTVPYRMERSGPLNVHVFDLLGRRVTTLFDGSQIAGAHTVAFNGADLPSGVYFVRMEADGHVQSRKVVLQR